MMPRRGFIALVACAAGASCLAALAFGLAARRPHPAGLRRHSGDHTGDIVWAGGPGVYPTSAAGLPILLTWTLAPGTPWRGCDRASDNAGCPLGSSSPCSQ